MSKRRRGSEVPLSADEIRFADAYLDLANEEAHLSAWKKFIASDNAEERFKLVMSVVQRAQLPEHEEALGLLGADPMEDLMSDWFLDRLKDYLPFSQELRYCLSNVRMEFEPEPLLQRLLHMRGVH
jgi:hypothetical protein